MIDINDLPRTLLQMLHGAHYVFIDEEFVAPRGGIGRIFAWTGAAYIDVAEPVPVTDGPTPSLRVYRWEIVDTIGMPPNTDVWGARDAIDGYRAQDHERE